MTLHTVRRHSGSLAAVIPIEPTWEEVALDIEARHGQGLFGFVRRLGLSDDQADDAVQEVIVRLWSELRRGTVIENPRGWAYRAIYRLAMDEHRLRRRVSGMAERLGRLFTTGQDPFADDRTTV